MSPSFQGLDRAVAPAPAMAKRMLDTINGRWWNVYIGGPESGGHGWGPDVVRQYARQGIDRFMLTYVGRQSRGPLTRAQAEADAMDALEIARGYGYTGDFPLCLDVELPTFNSSPSKTIEYVRAWCAAVRQSGARPGVYANPAPLIAMAKAKVPASFVWVASWVSTTASRRNPHDAKGMPANLWGEPGQRAWQYAGIINGEPCNVLGLNVDINVADLGCLAPAPGGQAGSPHVGAKHRRVLRGARGPVVVRLTHRLSVLRSRRTGRPYLDGPRKRFDAETDAALKAFQVEQGLPGTGVYGRKSARVLLNAVRRAKEQQQLAHQPSSNGSNGAGATTASAATASAATAGAATGATSLPKLVREFQRLDAAADRAWQQLEAYGRKRRQVLAHVQANPKVSLTDVTASLARIEKQLAMLVELETREVALAERPVLAPGAAGTQMGEAIGGEASWSEAHGGEAYGREPGGEAYGGEPGGSPATGEAYMHPEHAVSGPADAGASGSNGTGANPDQPLRSLAALSTKELDGLIDRLDERLDKARRVRIARYARVEKALAKLPHTPAVKPRPAGGAGPAPDPTPTHSGGGAGNGKPPVVAHSNVRALQRGLNRFTGRYLEGIAPLVVDGKKGPETNKRIRTVKYYLGYAGSERRSASVKRAFVRRLRHPRSPRSSSPAMLARAESRRRKQRERAKLVVAGVIEGTPKHIIDAIVLPIAESCGIRRTPAENDAANARHGPTISGSLSDHQGPPGRAWAADISNGGSPTPEMDRLARRLAQRFNINWPGFGLHSATHGGYRFQLIYRTHEGGNHFNHVHFGVKDV
jgi:peptidoglycan hydrolase-like protein with peptidoglycan-binding domain